MQSRKRNVYSWNLEVMAMSEAERRREQIAGKKQRKPIRANYAVIGDDGILRMLDENEFWKCPSCVTSFKDVELRPLQKYCHVCGQAIDWSGEK